MRRLNVLRRHSCCSVYGLILFSYSLLSVTLNLSGFDFSKYLEISSEQGLPGTTVRCLEQDQYGIIWIGVEGIGLCKYDGHDFITFQSDKNDPYSLNDNNVEAVIEDSKGRMWVGTMNGLNLLDRTTNLFKSFKPATDNPASFLGNLVFDIIEDNQGRIWFGTERGLCVFNEESENFTEVLFADKSGSHSLPRIFDLFCDQFGFIWISTKNGLFKLEPDNGICLPVEIKGIEDAPLHPVEFFATTEDREGRIWVGTDAYLLMLNEGSSSFDIFDITGGKGDPRESGVSCLLTDSRGYLWVGTWSDGLRVINPTSLEMVERYYDPRVSAGIQSDANRALLEDKNGMIWIGVKHAGIMVYDPRREVFRHIRGSRLFGEGLKDHHVFSLKADGEKLWIGTLGSGVFYHDPADGSFKQFCNDPENPDSIQNNRIEWIYPESKNEVWLCNGSGVSVLDPTTGHVRNFPFVNCRDIIQKEESKYWVASSSGMAILNSETGEFEDFPVIDGIDLSTQSKIDIRKIHLDKNGTLWISSNIKGLWAYQVSKNKLTKIILPNKDGVSAPDIRTARAFLEDSKGRFWICTRLNGLFLLNRENMDWENYSVSEGMPTKTFFGILEDKFGNLWLSSYEGITSFNPVTKSIIVYDVAYGLQGQVFENHCYASTTDGYFYFGGSNGLNSFKPDQVKKSQYPADIVFSSIKVNGKEVVRDEINPISLKLPYDQNSISMSFSLLDYSFPGENEYEYRMTGIDSDWQNAGHRNFASYPSLSPGSYVFEVIARNPNEELISDQLSFELIITSPYWETALFRAFIAIIIFLLIGTLFAYGIYRERLQNHHLEKQVKERTSELKSANSKLQEQTNELAGKGEEIERQNDELTQHKFYLEELVLDRTQKLELAKDKAEESDKLKSAFIANMSHEIRTPLNAIMGFSHLIAMEAKQEDQFTDYVTRISENTEMLVQLLNDIIDFSILESGKLKLNITSIDAQLLFNEFSHEFRILAMDRVPSGVNYLVDSQLESKAELIIESDRIRLKQILINLVTNACKFTSKGTITFGIKFNESENEIAFWVKDTGIGIAKENHEAVFDRFHKIVDETKEFYQGTGLGLSICNSLATSLGCRIELDSEPGIGSTFILHVPAKRGSHPTPVSVFEFKENESIDVLHVDWHDKTILVAEDTQNNFEILKKFLESTRVNLVHATNGEDAIQKFKELKERPDLLLFDIKMPKMLGDQALKEIRKIASEIPAIAQTAHALPVEKDEILNAGFQECLIKPLGRKKLIRLLAKYL